MKKALLILLIAVGLCAPASADVPSLSASGSFTGTGRVGIVRLSGQSACEVTLTGTGAGLTVVPQGSGDNQASWNTISAIGSGSLTANGHYAGAVVAGGMTAFALNVTAISSGTESYFITCSGASSSPAVGSGGFALQQTSAGALWTTIASSTLAQRELLDVGGGPNGVLIVSPGGLNSSRLTSTSPTACTSLATTAGGRLNQVWEAASTEAVTLTLYDEGATPTCAAADVIATIASLAVATADTGILKFNYPLTNGLAYKLSAALTGTVIITRTGT